MQKTRYIPQDYKVYLSNGFGAVYQKEGHPIIMAFAGGQSKPKFHYRFKTEAEMEVKAKDFLKKLADYDLYKATRKDERKKQLAAQMEAVKVGDLFSYSWGYDQTNVDFFQVVEKKAKSFVMRQIASKIVGNSAGGPMSADVAPVKDRFVSEKLISKTSFSMPFGILSKTDETRSHYNSWYA